MTDEPVIPQPLGQNAILDLLAAGAHIQRDRHGAVVISQHGRCCDDWEDLRRRGWLQQTTAGTFVLGERGREAFDRLDGKLEP